MAAADILIEAADGEVGARCSKIYIHTKREWKRNRGGSPVSMKGLLWLRAGLASVGIFSSQGDLDRRNLRSRGVERVGTASRASTLQRR